MSKQVVGYDFRISQKKKDGTLYDHNFIGSRLLSICKKFVFQLEKGAEGGYMHFQGRLSLRKATIKSTLLEHFRESFKCDYCDLPHFLEPTSAGVHSTSNFNYVLKVDTRVEGPWTEKDFVSEVVSDVYIPRQYRGMMDKLYPYQKFIFDSRKVFEIRKINLIVDASGNNGKSTIGALCALMGGGMMIPPLNDMKEVMQMICDKCMNANNRSPSPIIVDMPRAMCKDKLNGIYSALEYVKLGQLYDPRYSHKEFWIDSPQIWVFSNAPPDEKLLTSDRWAIWSIDSNKEFVPYMVNPTKPSKMKFLKCVKVADEVVDDCSLEEEL